VTDSLFLQQAFDKPWAPTLPDDFVVAPDEIRQVGQSLLERRRSGKQKQPHRAGMIVPEFGKISRPATLGKPSCRRKARPEG
jgi:hypothetical protein